MQKEMIALRAEAAFNEAMAEMQPKLPVIARNGRIEIKEKGGNRVIQSTKYALWEDINEAIVPILGAHGFSLTFKTGMTDDGRVKVTGELKHRDGHKEVTVMVLPHDSTGSKNAVQAIGSSTSYGKRYAAEALLNITSRGQDDDGVKGGAPGTITAEQLKKLEKLIDEVDGETTALIAYLHTKDKSINALADIPAEKFETVCRIVETKGKR